MGEFYEERHWDGLIHMLSLKKIGLSVQDLFGGGAHIHRQQDDLLNLLLFFQIKKAG
jgi:hypothetical protein